MLYIILMHISRFMFFANDLYYWLFWYLAYINDVRQKKQIWVIFLVWIKKMGHKAVETTHNISDEFGPGTANECTV